MNEELKFKLAVELTAGTLAGLQGIEQTYVNFDNLQTETNRLIKAFYQTIEQTIEEIETTKQPAD